MKEIPFVKYHGAGNDFVLIDNRAGLYKLSEKEIQKICHRHFGIGSDGLMLLEKADGFDFKMVFYNPDASKDMMCGNGGRCIVAFAHSLGIINNKASFLAPDGKHTAEIIEKQGYKYIVKLSLSDVKEIINFQDGQFLNAGTPHFVKQVDNLETLNLKEIGSKIRYDKRFEKTKGSNANFIEIVKEGEINIRTYERGVEDETLACGTGITASAIAYSEKYNPKTNPITINSKGGKLKVYFTKTNSNTYSNIFLEGEAEKVFEGKIVLD